MENTQEIKKNSVFRRVKYLTLMQIGDQVRGLKTGGNKKLVSKILLKVLFMAISIVAFTALFFVIRNFFSFELSKDLIVTLIFITQLISIVACLGGMILVLFVSKENTMLLAFPCNYSEIFLSKIIVFALDEIKKSLIFILPLLIGFGINAGVGVIYWLQLPIIWLTLCLLPVFIGAIMAIPAIYIIKFLKSHVFIYALFLSALIIAGYLLVYWILSQIEPPLNIAGKYARFLEAVRQAFATINKISLFYSFIGNSLFGDSTALYFSLTLLVVLGFGVLCFLVAMPFYFKAASSTAENSSKKVHKIKYGKGKSLFITFLKKELKILFRSSDTVTSIVTAVLLFPTISYVFNFIMSLINTSSLGIYMTIAFNMMITLSLLGSHNANSASAISREGNEFAVLKTAPSNTSLICWAKLAVTAAINVLSLITTAIMLVFSMRVPIFDVIAIVITIFFISVGQIAWGFELDLRNPKITEYASKGDAVTDNGNVAKAIAIAFLVSTLVGLLSLILLLDSYVLGWVRILLIAFVFMLARLYLLHSNLKTYFDGIQG